MPAANHHDSIRAEHIVQALRAIAAQNHLDVRVNTGGASRIEGPSSREVRIDVGIVQISSIRHYLRNDHLKFRPQALRHLSPIT